ncbi:glycosyltransferase family 61 protein [Kluyvera intermedia]|uniref:glycosyltransferase family 61 protein n=1 Tax=Kluyvera intermedia TaxID=61648 RepID=UPI0035258865
MYRSFQLRSLENYIGHTDIEVVNILPSYMIEADIRFSSGGDCVNIKELSDIFTKTYHTNDVFLITISDAVIGPRAIGTPRYWPVLFKGGYIRDFINPMAMNKLHEQGVLEVASDFSSINILRNDIEFQHIRGKSIWIYVFGNIDHFYRESLPILQALKEIQTDLNAYNIVISSDRDEAGLKEFIEIIKLYGVNVEQIVIAKNGWLRFDSLLTMNFSALGHLHTPGKFYLDTCEYIRNSIVTNTHFSPSKIFVSRKYAHQRRIDNEDELSAFFSSEGFFVCDPGEYSISEQVSLFANAKIIVGIHGMGLANSCFADKLTLLMEIMFSEWNRVSYFRTAQIKNSKYAIYWLKPSQDGVVKINMEAFKLFYHSIDKLNG